MIGITREYGNIRGPIAKSTTPRSQTATVLYTVTGTVEILLYGICTTSIDNGNVKVEVGVANATASIIDQTTGETIDANHVWVDTGPAECESLPSWKVIAAGADIIETVSGAAASAGAITYYCYWRPVSAGADLVAA